MGSTLPIIDISGFDERHPTSMGSRRVAGALHRGLADVGFLYIRNHGVRPALVEALIAGARAFFALPRAVKETVAMRHGGRTWRGWFPIGGELTAERPDWKEGLYLGQEHSADHPDVVAGEPMHGPNLWPQHPSISGLSALVDEYLAALIQLGHRLMSAVALGLGLPPGYFRERFSDRPTILFRLFNYPCGLGTEDQPWGVQEHTDMGFLTILLQDHIGGLEVFTRDRSWLPAPPIPETFVVNIGDMLEYWTHGLYRATLHRARNASEHDRLSLPFFFDPNWHATLEPIARARIAHPIGISADRQTRWDGLDLHTLDQTTTYGAFVWRKIQAVFPALAGL